PLGARSPRGAFPFRFSPHKAPLKRTHSKKAIACPQGVFVMRDRHYPTLWRYILRDSGRRPGRTLLTVTGIVLAVAAVTAVRLSNHATRESYAGMYRQLAGRADLEVLRGDGQSTFRADLDALNRVKGVQTAVPLLQLSAGLPGSDGPAPLFLVGIDPRHDSAVRTLELLEGDALDR